MSKWTWQSAWTRDERYQRAMRHVRQGHGLERCAKMAAVKVSVLRRWLAEAAAVPTTNHRKCCND